MIQLENRQKTFNQRVYTDGKCAHEKTVTTIRMIKIRICEDPKYW